MELGGIEVVLVQTGTVWQYVVGRSYGLLTEWNIETVYEIDIVALVDAFH